MSPTVASPWFAGHAYGIGICFVRDGAPEAAELRAAEAMQAEGWLVCAIEELVAVDEDAVDAADRETVAAALSTGIASRVELGTRRWIDRARTIREGDPAFPLPVMFERWCAEITRRGAAVLLFSSHDRGYAGCRFLAQDVVPIWATPEALAPWQSDWPAHYAPKDVPLAELVAMVEGLQERGELVAVGLEALSITFHPAAILDALSAAPHVVRSVAPRVPNE